MRGGRGILKVRAMAEWGIVSWAKNKMSKGREKRTVEDSETCRWFNMAGVQASGDEGPRGGAGP